MFHTAGIATLIVVCLTLQGCLGRPPPPYPDYWKKNGESFVNVSKALLECGANNPFADASLFPYPEGENNDQWAKVELCMMKAGFKYKYDRSRLMCPHRVKDIEICKPESGGLVPERSIDVRLGSQFCNDPWYSRSPACQP